MTLAERSAGAIPRVSERRLAIAAVAAEGTRGSAIERSLPDSGKTPRIVTGDTATEAIITASAAVAVDPVDLRGRERQRGTNVVRLNLDHSALLALLGFIRALHQPPHNHD